MDYTVKAGEWLSKIALAHGFRDGGAAIWDANPKLHELTGGNPDVLQEGWVLTIPKPREKSVDVATGAKHTFKLRVQKKNLRVSLQGPDGNGLKGWACTVSAGEKSLGKGSSAGDGHFDVKDLDQTLAEAELEVQDSYLFGAWSFPAEKIKLHLGTLDPVAGEPQDAIEAVQKILTNLGYYTGKIDGDAGPLTRAALRAFQQSAGIRPVTGLADKPTCEKLVKAQGGRTTKPGEVESASGDTQDDAAGAGGSEAAHRGEKVTAFSEYLEPTSSDQTKISTLGKFHFFPHEAYVAPCDPGREADNPNALRMPARKFVFLDVGRWIGDNDERFFGMIWGRHIYLCRYHSSGGRSEAGKRPGLDTDFLKAMEGRVEIVRWANAAWAPAGEFDWDKLVIVLPDVHLMSSEKANVWFYADSPGSSYQLKAETELLDFANRLTKLGALQSKVQVIHIGDSYDLWVGCDSCLYKKNDTRTMELVDSPDSVDKLVRWIREIQGQDDSDWVNKTLGQQGSTPALNPAEQAFRALDSAYGADSGMVYIYGNHDNYLILDPVTSAAGIPKRRAFLELPGVFIEHAHRMEARFWGPLTILPHNFDGDPSGYKVTIGLYEKLKTKRDAYLRGLKLTERVHEATIGKIEMGAKRIAGEWAAIRDQPEYWGEQAQIWLGRQSENKLKPPHVFVIGHTHLPELHYIDIDAWRK